MLTKRFNLLAGMLVIPLSLSDSLTNQVIARCNAIREHFIGNVALQLTYGGETVANVQLNEWPIELRNMSVQKVIRLANPYF